MSSTKGCKIGEYYSASDGGKDAAAIGPQTRTFFDIANLPGYRRMKHDLKKAHKALYSAPVGDFVVLDVPPRRFFMVDGHGDPNTSGAYRGAVEALYAASYTLKFMSRDEGQDYTVPPLEGLWWCADLSAFLARRKDDWSWTMMIPVPDFVPAEMTRAAIERAMAKRASPDLSRLRVDVLDEGRAVQTLHIGSYDDEGPILARLHDDFLPAHGLVETGHHHEIYLSDPRRTSADRLKTLLRQPVAPIAAMRSREGASR